MDSVNDVEPDSKQGSGESREFGLAVAALPTFYT